MCERGTLFPPLHCGNRHERGTILEIPYIILDRSKRKKYSWSTGRLARVLAEGIPHHTLNGVTGGSRLFSAKMTIVNIFRRWPRRRESKRFGVMSPREALLGGMALSSVWRKRWAQSYGIRNQASKAKRNSNLLWCPPNSPLINGDTATSGVKSLDGLFKRLMEEEEK